MGRICIVGIDGVPPDLVFAPHAPTMPHLRRLIDTSLAGPLYSCMPPITVPAWATMLTGCDPGTLGVYGFHDRQGFTYGARTLASSLSYTAPPIWRLLESRGVRTRLLCVPQTYPPLPLHGAQVSGHPTPPDQPIHTYPPELSVEVQALRPLWDQAVQGFRGATDRDACVQAVQAHGAALHELALDWLKLPDWELFVVVDMGPDRLHHLVSPTSALNDPDALQPLTQYYRRLDTWIGAIAQEMRPDDVLLVVSDHGAVPMQGGFCLNTFLQQEGLLTLHETPPAGTPLADCRIDWSRTKAWSDGGFVGRIYLNIAGREPHGIVPMAARATLCAEIEARITAQHVPPGCGPHRVYDTHTLYPTCLGTPPDLIVVPGAYALRALGSLGHTELYLPDNDTGIDLGNHGRWGMFVLHADQVAAHCGTGSMAISIYDVAPTLLALMNVAPTPAMRGTSLLTKAQQGATHTDRRHM